MVSHIRLPVKCTQTEARLLAFRVDGSAVTTSAAAAGLLEGARDATVAKGSGATSNEVTFTWDIAFGRVPVVVCTPITDDCHVMIKSVSASGCVIETFQNDDHTSGVDDADFHMMVLGWDSAQAY